MIFGGRISVSHEHCNQNLKLKVNQSLLKIKREGIFIERQWIFMKKQHVLYLTKNEPLPIEERFLVLKNLYHAMSNDIRLYEACKSWEVAEVSILKRNSHTLMDYVSSAGVLYQNIIIRLLTLHTIFYDKHALLWPPHKLC